ncbi:MAG: acyloxyacyl hydrolase [Bacteroidetes bacterium]|nr:acyloxyacyl hydrolase [Bacteroidota bacterium]
MDHLVTKIHIFLRLAGILLIITTNANLASAQFEHKLFSSNLIIEGKAHYGFLYAQHLELELFNAHFPAFEIVVEQLTYGKRKWERDYNYPIIGISLFHTGFGNNPALGSAYALMPLINFPLIKDKSLTAGFRFAIGIGYITKPFNRITNYKNLAIGSHFNAAVNLMFEARYRINYYLTATTGVSLQHFSNGSLKLPNYGINLFLFNVGFAYRPFKENRNIGNRYFAPTEAYSAIVRRAIEIDIGGLVGYKNMQAVYGKNYWVTHFYGNSFLQVSPKSKFGIGLDFSYDPSQITLLEMNGITVSNKFAIIRPGANVAYQLAMSRLGFIFNLGYYLGGEEKSNGPLYEKISLQYGFSEHLYAAVMIKVHWGRADYIGWGIGYKLNVLFGKKTVR